MTQARKRLLKALNKDSLEKVERCLQEGASVDSPLGKRAEPALHVAVRQNCQSDIVEFILGQPEANINAVGGKKGRTALHIAAGKANLRLVTLLLAHGAHVDQRDEGLQETALHKLARKAAPHKDACQVAKALFEAGASPFSRRSMDHKRPTDLFRAETRLRKVLFEAEAEWEQRARSMPAAQVAVLSADRRALETNETRGREGRIAQSVYDLYPLMMRSEVSRPRLIEFVLNLPAREQYSIFSRAFVYEDRSDSLRRMITAIMLNASDRLQDYLHQSTPCAPSRQVTYLGRVSTGTAMFLNVIREALRQNNQEHLSFFESLLTTEHNGEPILLNVLTEALNLSRRERPVLDWMKRRSLDDNLMFPRDHLHIIRRLTSRKGKRAFFEYCIDVRDMSKLLRSQAACKDEAFFQTFIIQSALYKAVVSSEDNFRSFWASRDSEFFLGLLQPKHWIALLFRNACGSHAGWLCKKGALHRCLLMSKDFSLQQLGASLSTELATVCWHGMTVLEMACFTKNTRVIDELSRLDCSLLTDSKALTLTTDFEILLTLSRIWKDVEWKASHDLASSRAPERAILEVCKAMIKRKEHLQGKGKVNPVSLAVQYGRNRVLKHYLRINPDLANLGEPSPLWYATITGNEQAVKALLKKLRPEDVGRPAPDGTTPLLVALVKGFTDIYNLIRGRTSVAGELERAALYNRTHAFPSAAPADKEYAIQMLREPVQCINPQFSSSSSLILDKGPEEEGIGELTRMFPMHVEPEDDKEWTAMYLTNSSINVDEVKRKHLLRVCGLSKDRRNRPSDLFQTILKCKGHKESESSRLTCPAIQALMQFLAQLEHQLRQDDSKLKALGLRLSIIGSIYEGSRLGPGTEIDANILFKYLKSYPFCKSNSSYSLQLSEDGLRFFQCNNLMDFVLRREGVGGYELNILAFMRHLLYALKSAIEKIKAQLPTHLQVVMTNDSFYKQRCRLCEQVSKQELRASNSSATAHYHCPNCLPPVTMTKLGPCIQLLYGGLQVCTVDLIPLFPHSEEPLQLIRQMVLTPSEERRPGWEKALKDYIDRDRFLNEEDCQPKENTGTLVALKLQHFGEKDNYMIRGTQEINMKLLREEPRLLEAYIALKVPKDVLHVNCKSYMLKKTLLKDSMIRYLDKAPTSLQLFYEALIQPELKPIFEQHIHLEMTQQKIDEQQTDIVIYRNL